MKNLLFTTTRYGSRCRKAALLLLALGLAALCALFNPSCAQGVQAMVKNQPFPYRSGVAMDSSVYAATKAKLLAADALRMASRAAIDSLQKEIRATRKALDDQTLLGRYDAGKAEALALQMNALQAQLVTAQVDFRRADDAIKRIVQKLPKRLRNRAQTYDEIALAMEQYAEQLKWRPLKWGAAGVTIGFLLGVFL